MRRISLLILHAISIAAATPLLSACQTRSASSVDRGSPSEYVGVYQWERDGFLYVQLWSELSGRTDLVAFDESGEVRTLFPDARDTFVAGPGAGVRMPVQSQITFTRDATGRPTGFRWYRSDNNVRTAQRVDIERRGDVRFANGAVELAGTLIAPAQTAQTPAIILVHGSGAEDREYLLPFARFLIRHGIAVLGYDKRGVGGSTGDWRTASFEDLAGDVVAAFKYLKSRSDIDSAQIGLLGWSQAGWVMPLAAVREQGIAFVISIAGAGVPAAETTLDQARNEMVANGMRPQMIEHMVDLMRLQYQFAETGTAWDRYAAARAELVAQIGRAPETFPGDSTHTYWASLRRQYFYNPEPTLQRLRTPTLALFGELDNNILAAKNSAAWQSALESSGNRDFTIRTVAQANHLMLEAKVGNNAEMPTLQRFVPSYFTIVSDWLRQRVPGFTSR